MSVEEIERVVRAVPESTQLEDDETRLATLTSCLVEAEIPPAALEEVLHAYQNSDPTRQRAIFKTLETICANGAKEESILAAVRGLSRRATAEQLAPPQQRVMGDTTSFRH